MTDRIAEMPPNEPGGRVPAPGPLRLVQEFLNTNDIEEGLDRFASPELLGHWLGEHGLIRPAERLTRADLDRAIRVREAVRALAMANNGWELAPEAVETLNDIGSGALLRVRFSERGEAALERRSPGIEGALSQILASVCLCMVEGSWERLKACRRDTCRWVFYDHSRNRSSTWCAMSICGNREKTKAYYRRRTKERGRLTRRSSM